MQETGNYSSVTVYEQQLPSISFHDDGDRMYPNNWTAKLCSWLPKRFDHS